MLTAIPVATAAVAMPLFDVVGDPDLSTVEGRIAAVCRWFDLTPPALTPGEDPLQSEEVLDWMIASDVSIDWLVRGDVKGLVIAFRNDEARRRAALSETPIQRLFREWEAAMERCCAPGLSDEEGDALDKDLRHPLEDAIATATPTDMRDLAIKVVIGSGDGCWGLDDALTLECAAIAGRNFDQLPRCLFKEG
ncbi:hypothetical protein Rumeso_01737 [Rubellimicrobium mesophilum DSM 19309]|uniref:Uncharacterized protein n=1 Tax=Rubellimicrobium mesophilum DSM 19309 TaxID=442562 RepID=A0A017HSP6_9RHOB|nr:hypothetical protein [Rubellimicrobium mesophilum]EYD76779.1 hypothetical protein Rumeso_01737 [Rubellimicrobium mesophilum DSM 19309]